MATTDLQDINDIFQNKVLHLEGSPSRATFYRWVQEGYRFAHLANGGGFYLLVLIAAKDLRTVATSLDAQAPWEIGKMLREPATCSK